MNTKKFTYLEDKDPSWYQVNRGKLIQLARVVLTLILLSVIIYPLPSSF